MVPVYFPSKFPVELPSTGHCYQGKFLHVFKLLPGITLSILQQHIYEHPNFSACGMPHQVSQHPQHSFGFVITVHFTHPVAQSIAYREQLGTRRHPDNKLSYSEALFTHDTIEEALKFVYCRQTWTTCIEFCRYLPGINLLVLQQHCNQAGVFCQSLQPYTVDCDPQVFGGFFIKVCLDHPVALNEALLDEALLGIDHRQVAHEAFHNPAPAPPLVQPRASLSQNPPRAAKSTRAAVKATIKWAPKIIPMTRTATTAKRLKADPKKETKAVAKSAPKDRAKATHKKKATARSGTESQLPPYKRISFKNTNVIQRRRAKKAANARCRARAEEKATSQTGLTALMHPSDSLPPYGPTSAIYQPQPETPPPAKHSTHPTTPLLTLPEFFQHLWNLSPATPQVSLPSILGLKAPLSTLIQCVSPRIHPFTNRSSTWSLVSYGLQ
jgi:hypothetical protein